MNYHTLRAIDFDKHAVATYAANFPGVDARCASVADEIDALPYADILMGGPPCTPHSHAGKRLASADARDCGPDFVAAVRKVRPRHFLMENVPGLLSSEGGNYWHLLYAAMEEAGYAVQYRVQDAVEFGVPQFRKRLWVWGIRNDLYAAGMRHDFPRPTHAWPPPVGGMLFGKPLLPGVTVGEALGLDGELILEAHGCNAGGTMSTNRPAPTMRSGNLPGCSDILVPQIRRDHPTTEPCPTVEARAALGGGSCLKLISGSKCRRDGKGTPRGPLVKSIGNPSFAIDGTPPSLEFQEGEEAIEYRWSDAYRAKNPPISRSATEPTVKSQWHKGMPNGCLLVDDPKHPINKADQPALTQRSGGSGHGPPHHATLLEIDTKQARTRRTVGEGSPTVAHDSRHHLRESGIYVRRLTPLEVARLQSVPDCFVWPEGISKTAMYRIVGNGWASAHAAAFARSFHRADPEATTVISLFCGGGLGDVGWHQRYWSLEGGAA